MRTRAAVGVAAGTPLEVTEIGLDPMVTHSFWLDRITHGLDLMHEGAAIRAVVAD